MENQLVTGILKEDVTMKVNGETIFIPAGQDVLILVVYSKQPKETT